MTRSRCMFWLCCTTAVMMTIALADAQTFFTNGRYGKRSADLRFRVASRSADDRFFGGPRYGRSGSGSSVIFGNGELDARNPERFFIGSRYGKRSELEQIVPQLQTDELPATSNSSQEKEIILECFPIGVDQLYHCERKNENPKTQDGV